MTWPIGASSPGQSAAHISRATSSVQLGDAVRGRGEAQRERGQAEAGLIAVATELEQALVVEPGRVRRGSPT